MQISLLRWKDKCKRRKEGEKREERDGRGESTWQISGVVDVDLPLISVANKAFSKIEETRRQAQLLKIY